MYPIMPYICYRMFLYEDLTQFLIDFDKPFDIALLAPTPTLALFPNTREDAAVILVFRFL